MTAADVTAIATKLEAVLSKIDDLHRELREDISEIKDDHANTKKELSELKSDGAKLRGAIGVVIFVVPFIVFFLDYILRP